MDPKEGTTTLEAQTSGAAQVVPPAPVDPLQTNFPIAALEKRLDVIKHLSASCSAKQLQQKEDKNIWHVIFESKNGGSPQFSGKSENFLFRSPKMERRTTTMLLLFQKPFIESF